MYMHACTMIYLLGRRELLEPRVFCVDLLFLLRREVTGDAKSLVDLFLGVVLDHGRHFYNADLQHWFNLKGLGSLDELSQLVTVDVHERLCTNQ